MQAQTSWSHKSPTTALHAGNGHVAIGKRSIGQTREFPWTLSCYGIFVIIVIIISPCFVFRATIVHGFGDYWLNVTSPHLCYDVNCVTAMSAASGTIAYMNVFSQLLLALAIVVLIGM